MAKQQTPPPSQQQRARQEPPKATTAQQGPPPDERQAPKGASGAAPRPAPSERDVERAQGAAEKFVGWLHAKSDQLAKWCDGSTITPDDLIRFAAITFKREPKFHPVEVWPSIYLALATAGHLGLEPSGPLGEGWIVPRWDKRLRMNVAMWQTGYRGYITLLTRNGSCKRVRAFTVYQADVFQIDQGSTPRIVHEIFTGASADRGEVIGAYAIAWMSNGEQEYEWVPRVDIDKSRDMAADGSGAWNEWFDQMARRLPIKRLANQLPVGPKVRRAVAVEDAQDQDGIHRILEASAEDVGQQRALPPAVTTTWPIPSRSTRKDALKEKLGARPTGAAAARAIATPPREQQREEPPRRWGEAEGEQMPDWATPAEDDQNDGGPPPDDGPPEEPGDDEEIPERR